MHRLRPPAQHGRLSASGIHVAKEQQELRNGKGSSTLLVIVRPSCASRGLGLRCVRRSSAGPGIVPPLSCESRPPGPAAETSGPGSMGVDVSRAGRSRLLRACAPEHWPALARADSGVLPPGSCSPSYPRGMTRRWGRGAAPVAGRPSVERRGRRTRRANSRLGRPSGWGSCDPNRARPSRGGSRSGRRHAWPAPTSSRRASRSGKRTRGARHGTHEHFPGRARPQYGIARGRSPSGPLQRPTGRSTGCPKPVKRTPF